MNSFDCIGGSNFARGGSVSFDSLDEGTFDVESIEQLLKDHESRNGAANGTLSCDDFLVLDGFYKRRERIVGVCTGSNRSCGFVTSPFGEKGERSDLLFTKAGGHLDRVMVGSKLEYRLDLNRNSKKRRDVKYIAVDVKVLNRRLVPEDEDGGGGQIQGDVPKVDEGYIGVFLEDLVVNEKDILALNCYKGDEVTVVDVCGKPLESYFRNPPPASSGYVKVKKKKEYVSGWVPLDAKKIRWSKPKPESE